MEKKKDNNTINKQNDVIPKKENTPLINILDKIPRCLECNIISSLNLYYKEGKPIIFAKIIIKEIFLQKNI